MKRRPIRTIVLSAGLAGASTLGAVAAAAPANAQSWDRHGGYDNGHNRDDRGRGDRDDRHHRRCFWYRWHWVCFNGHGHGHGGGHW